jgi:DNA invertase Pin-like site-specific DNA recombinase
MPRKKSHPNRIYRVIGEPGPGAHGVGYVRYSSDMQDPATLVTQKRRIGEFFDLKRWILDGFVEEPEQSAKYEEIAQRPAFARMLDEAGTTYQVIVCYMNDRWARNKVVAYLSLARLRRAGVWWATTDGKWDIDRVEEDGWDVAYTVDVAMNAAYVRKLSKRGIDAFEDRGRAGYHNGKTLFGYLQPEYPKAPDGAPSTWRPPRMPARVDPANFPALVRIGELAAQGWTDQAIADALGGHVTSSPRFGARPLTKDTIAAIRRSWFPCEFTPGCGHGTIDTPSGELVEGKHPSAWPYALWQRMKEAKRGQYHRPRAEARRRAHAFSRIVVCASCRRALRVSPSKGVAYYKDTSLVRRLPCTAYGCLSVKSTLVVAQFGALLASVALPPQWREAVAARCAERTQDPGIERTRARRSELEAEQDRLVNAYAKGFLSEEKLDAQVGRIRAELVTLPLPQLRDAEAVTQAALAAGETLADMAGYWGEASDEERRDMVWALLALGGLVYDLEHQGIVGLIPRPDTLPVLALGLGAGWEQRDDGLWLRETAAAPATYARSTGLADAPPTRSTSLSPAQREQALELVRAGRSPQQVADALGVSYWVILRLLKRHAPAQLPAQQQPKLSPTQQQEAHRMLAQGKILRQVGAHFGVSYGAIWRLTQRNRRDGATPRTPARGEHHQPQRGARGKPESKGGEA